jgi:ABC-type multidrug transport system fused ATPase/permease subunit
LYSFNNGYIEVDNLKINTNHKINLWQKKIGYVSQATFLKEGTVRNNVAFGIEDNEIDNDKVLKSMESAELGNFLSKMNYDLNSNIKETGINLSLGEQQRFGIARALYNQPELIIFDEATNALDHETEENIIKEINLLKNKKTIIFVSHRIKTLQKYAEIYELSNNCLVKKN